MTRESIIELQKIDCNCNDCKFMQRDMMTYKYWQEWWKRSDLEDFDRRKTKAIHSALRMHDPAQMKAEIIRILDQEVQHEKMRTNFGNCTKMVKPVSFIPGVCQIETQECFEHRKS